MTLPSGTITFLFTDIEGSTQLWQRQPATMPAALARHHELLAAAINANGGYVFQVVGDAFCAAFTTPAAGLAAALAAQRALRDEPWGDTGAILVRMALHTGTTPVQPGDFKSGEYRSGITLSRTARLLSAAHGGQILLSQAAAELLRDHLPADVGLRDLDEHRLKDLVRPERLFQPIVADLPAAFPPLRTLDQHTHNLPVQLTRFIGREREIEELGALIRAERLITLTGPGGTGKTRLALQVAAAQVEAFADGVFLVGLESITDPALVLPTIAQVLGVRERPAHNLVETLAESLRGKTILLVLDCFEQVLAAAPALSDLMTAAPRLTLLVASRSVLQLYGEVSYAVAPLPLPEARQAPLAELARNDSVTLFVERARAARAGFELTAENASAVAEICRQLDGLPLAIELAAARVRLLPPAKIVAQLQRSLQFLTGGPRDLPARHQTLRTAIDWSYHLLAEPERLLFGRLSVFAGGCTLEAAAAVVETDGSMLDRLAALVDQSLIYQRDGATGEPRFMMLATLRDYAAEQLDASGEGDVFRQRHAAHFLALAERADREMTPGPSEEAWLARLDEEHDNLRAALRCLIASDSVRQAASLCTCLRWFWEVRGHQREAATWFAAVLDLTGELPIEGRIWLLYNASVVSWYRGDFNTARQQATEAIDLTRAAKIEPLDPWLFINLARINIEQGEYEQARPAIAEAIAYCRRAGQLDILLAALVHQADVEIASQELAAARQTCEEALAVSRSVAVSSFFIPQVPRQLGEICSREQREAEALDWLQQSLAQSRPTHPPRQATVTIAMVAGLLASWPGRSRANRLQAARLWGAVSALQEAGGYSLARGHSERVQAQLAQARAEIGASDWDEAWREGRALTLPEAIAEAQRREPGA